MGPKPRNSLYYCGHCDKQLSKTVFYRHKRLYYDRRSKTWSSCRILADPDLHTASIASAFKLSSSEDEANDPFQLGTLHYAGSDEAGCDPASAAEGLGALS